MPQLAPPVKMAAVSYAGANFARRRRSKVVEPNYPMARGSKASYSKKQKRQAAHIEKGYEKRGVRRKTAEARAWATVNKHSGGGKKSGTGRKKSAR